MSDNSNIDTSLSRLREDEARQREILYNKIAIVTVVAALVLVVMFLMFYVLGPKRSLEMYITIIGEMVAVCLFGIGLTKLIK